MVVSFFAAIAGLLLLPSNKDIKTEQESTDRALIMMIFAYWLVYCVVAAVKPFLPTDWEMLLMSVQATGIIAYLLTLTCILSLPLLRIAVRQTE